MCIQITMEDNRCVKLLDGEVTFKLISEYQEGEDLERSRAGVQ